MPAGGGPSVDDTVTVMRIAEPLASTTGMGGDSTTAQNVRKP
jgi:hypothetical protein